MANWWNIFSPLSPKAQLVWFSDQSIFSNNLKKSCPSLFLSFKFFFSSATKKLGISNFTTNISIFFSIPSAPIHSVSAFGKRERENQILIAEKAAVLKRGPRAQWKKKKKEKKQTQFARVTKKPSGWCLPTDNTGTHTLSNWTLKFNGKEEEEEEGASRFDGNKFRTRNADKIKFKNSQRAHHFSNKVVLCSVQCQFLKKQKSWEKLAFSLKVKGN